MKLAKSFEKHLRRHLQEVYIGDERGDGYHIQVIAIDSCFSNMNRVQRSRHVFSIMNDFLVGIHAISVRAYTPQEWKRKKSSFSLSKYVHLHLSSV